MPYENIWEETGVYIRFTDLVNTRDIIESNEALYKDIRFDTIMSYQIADFLTCKHIECKAEEVRDIARRDSEASKRKPGVRVALVTDLQLIYGFSRMYQICTEQSSWETEIFDNLAAAREWIKKGTK